MGHHFSSYEEEGRRTDPEEEEERRSMFRETKVVGGMKREGRETVSNSEECRCKFMCLFVRKKGSP